MSKSEIRVYVAGVSWGMGPAPLDSSSGLWGTQQKEAALFPLDTWLPPPSATSVGSQMPLTTSLPPYVGSIPRLVHFLSTRLWGHLGGPCPSQDRALSLDA